MEGVFRDATAEVNSVDLRTGAIFTRESSMHPTSQYPVNQETLRPERTFVVDAELQVEATIASLKERFEEVRQREVKRMRGRLGELSGTQENAIESLSRGIIDQILDTPIAMLRASCGNSHDLIAIATVHCIFNLGDRLLQDWLV